MSTEATSPGRNTDTTSGIKVRDVVRDVVTEVAPEELAVLDGLVKFDDATVIRQLGRRVRRREPLGFGWGEVVALVTPVVWLVVNEAAKKAAGAAVDSTAKGAKALLRKIFRRKSADVVVPPLTGEQLGQVRVHLLETAAQQGLATERAEEMADAVVERLTGAGDPPEDPSEPDGPDGGGRPTRS